MAAGKAAGQARRAASGVATRTGAAMSSAKTAIARKVSSTYSKDDQEHFPL
jgi:hypothetical protein